MAFLIVGGVTVAVARSNPPTREYEEWGDLDRSSTRSVLFVASGASPRKRVWRGITTKPLTSAAADTLQAALLGSPPITCSGDLLGGSVSCFVDEPRRMPVGQTSAFREVISFDLLEA